MKSPQQVAATPPTEEEKRLAEETCRLLRDRIEDFVDPSELPPMCAGDTITLQLTDGSERVFTKTWDGWA